MNKTKTFKTFIFLLLVLTLISSVSAKNFIIYNSSDSTDAHFLVNGTTGYVGIGVNTPTSLLQIANDNWISAKNYAGTGTINMFKVNSANQIEVGAPLNIGSFEFTADSGLVTFVDMPVTSSASIGTSQSYVFKVDGENIFTVYSESDGAGGIQNKRIGIGTTTPTHALHVVGDVNITGSIYLNGTLLQDTNTWWNITGSNYLINSSNILEINETKLNATFVPYTGATTDVDLGSYNFTANNVNLDGFLKLYDPTESESFIIEWKQDGANYFPRLGNDYSEIWMGASNGDTIYINYDVGSYVGIGSLGNLQTMDIFGTLAITGNTSIVGVLDMNSNKITNLANGTDSQDAVTLSQLQLVNLSSLGGDVVGPSSATDNTLARFDGITGKLIQDSGVYLDDSNKVGIGTAAPLNQLDVAGGAVIGSALAGVTTAPANSLMVEEEIYSKSINVDHRQFWSTDFFYNNVYGTLPWWVGHLASGTIQSNGWAVSSDRLGILTIKSHATNANSGYYIQIGGAAFIFGGGEKTHFIFSPSNTTGAKVRMGWDDSSSTAEPTEGVWFQIENDVIFGKISVYSTPSNNVVQTTTNYTLTAGTESSAGTWYHGYITINSDASAALFEIYSSPERELLWNETITTTYIPTTTWRYTGHGVIAYTVAPGGTAQEIIKLDYMDLEIDRVLDR
jgi:hypothetical protein